MKARQGLFAEAIQFGESGLRETEKVNDGWLSGLIRIGLSIAYYYAGNYKESTNHSLVAHKLFKICGDTFGEMITAFWLMCNYDKTANHTLFVNKARTFSGLCINHDYTFFLTCDTIFSPFDRQWSILFIKAGRFSSLHDDLQQIIQLLDLTEITTHPGYKIDVHLLGPLTLFLGFEEVDDRSWQRDKAKELLAYFLLNRERYIPKEEIMRELWDSSDEKAADRDFKVP